MVWPGFGIHAVYPSRKHLSLKVKTLIDYLAENWPGPIGKPRLPMLFIY